jgi:DnaJ family protein B protein 12
MEVNKEEALRCLSIAQRHRNGSNLPSALKFAKKSVSLYETPEGKAMVVIIEREIVTGGSSSSSSTSQPSAAGGGANGARASGVEEHMTSAKSRPGHAGSTSAGTGGAAPKTAPAEEKAKKREYTPKQMEVVKRVKACKHHEYYEILAGELFGFHRYPEADDS